MIRNLLCFLAGAASLFALNLYQDFSAEVPVSTHVSDAAAQARNHTRALITPHLVTLATGTIADRRAVLDEFFYGPKIELARRLYPVQESVLEINGVYTEEFLPLDGVVAEHTDKVLINLHGGGFAVGARTEGQLESIPVANVSGMRVISVDYRQGPEHRFPAGSEDVATVYKHLLKEYKAENIGIFGCSAGGMLTAQATAWIASLGLPPPGAIGIFCASAGKFGTGDAQVITKAFGSALGDGEIEYFENASWDDPLVAPQDHPEVLAKFPPTLLITSTRDGALSGALVTHKNLISAGVYAQLHVYEGLEHYFFADTELEESKHVFGVISDFFATRLATTGLTTTP